MKYFSDIYRVHFHQPLKQIIITFTFIILVSSGICQRDTISLGYGGMYYIKDNKLPELINDCIFCNPEVMFNDRILLDSTKTMITRKISNPLGYTYYEWRNSFHTKSYEEINLKELGFKLFTFYTDSGDIIQQECESKNKFRTFYFSDSRKTLQFLQLSISTITADMLIKAYNIQPSKIHTNVTQFWLEVEFFSNGNIKSTGPTVEGLNEKNSNKYKLGEWSYYKENGDLIKRQTLKTLESY